MSLKGKVALVTGATRGVGNGIARGLGEAGATVYVTGRTVQEGDEAQPGTIQSVAAEVTSLGGKGIAVRCDHSVDADIQKLFERIGDEAGRLDILVNNVHSGIPATAETFARYFWESEPEEDWDLINRVGLRSHYIASAYAARMMVPRRSGLIVNVSSMGGLAYMFTASYGVGKGAMDRMAIDMAAELRNFGVTVVALWPGFVTTEFTRILLREASPTVRTLLATFHETPLLTGRAVAAFAADPNMARKTGKRVLTADIARKHRLTGEDGKRPPSLRNLSALMRAIVPASIGPATYLIPPIPIPLWLVAKFVPRHSLRLKGKGYRPT